MRLIDMFVCGCMTGFVLILIDLNSYNLHVIVEFVVSMIVVLFVYPLWRAIK